MIAFVLVAWLGVGPTGEAEAAFLAGRYDDAAAIWLRELEQPGADRGPIAFNLGLALEYSDRVAESAAALRTAVRCMPRSERARQELASVEARCNVAAANEATAKMMWTIGRGLDQIATPVEQAEFLAGIEILLLVVLLLVRRRRSARRAVAVVVLLLVAFGASVAARGSGTSEAVVVVPKLLRRDVPDGPSVEPGFRAGELVLVLERAPGRARIKTARLEGWVLEDGLRPVLGP